MPQLRIADRDKERHDGQLATIGRGRFDEQRVPPLLGRSLLRPHGKFTGWEDQPESHNGIRQHGRGFIPYLPGPVCPSWNQRRVLSAPSWNYMGVSSALIGSARAEAAR